MHQTHTISPKHEGDIVAYQLIHSFQQRDTPLEVVHDKVGRAEHEPQDQLPGGDGEKWLLKHFEANIDGQDAKWIYLVKKKSLYKGCC